MSPAFASNEPPGETSLHNISVIIEVEIRPKKSDSNHWIDVRFACSAENFSSPGQGVPN